MVCANERQRACQGVRRDEVPRLNMKKTRIRGRRG